MMKLRGSLEFFSKFCARLNFAVILTLMCLLLANCGGKATTVRGNATGGDGATISPDISLSGGCPGPGCPAGY